MHQTLAALANAPSKKMGRVEIIFPMDDGREGVMALPIRIGTDDKIRSALKACGVIETIEAIAA